MAVEQKVTFCRICEPLCGMVATVEDGKLTKLRPDPDHPLSRGYACPKGIAMAEVQNDPDRVLHPLRRTRRRRLRARLLGRRRSTTSATGCRRVLAEHGPGSVGWYMGNPGAFSYSHTLWVKGFLDALGSPHYYSRRLAGREQPLRRQRAAVRLAAAWCRSPTSSAPSFLLMVGANPLVSHGSVLSRAARARAAARDRERGGGSWSSTRAARRPRASSSTCRSGPDTDAWLLLSLLQRRSSRRASPTASTSPRSADGRRRARARWCAEHPPEATAARTGVPAAARARARARLRRRRRRRRLRAHRLLPRPLRHARRVPARRAQRRHRQPRPPRRRGLRRPAGRARRHRRAARARHLRQDAARASAASRT